MNHPLSHRKPRTLSPIIFALCLMLASLSLSPKSAGAAESYPQERGLDLSSLGDLLGEALSGSTGSSSAASSGNLSSLGGLLELFTSLTEGSRAIKDCTIKAIPDQTYTGSAIRPSLTITYNGTRLKKGTDYTVAYSDNTRVGTGKCKITGKGTYKGTKTVSFHIVRKGTSSGSSSKKATSSSKKSSFKVTLSKTSYTYNGSAKKPTVKVTLSGKSVTAKNYTVTYKNNKSVGKATVTVKGKGEYQGVLGEATFKIELKKTSLSSASSPAAESLKIGWNADSQAEGYQVQACTNKSFSSGLKKASVKGGSKKTYTFTGLTSGKTYYVRIRSYKKVGSTNWYSQWSAARQVKVK